MVVRNGILGIKNASAGGGIGESDVVHDNSKGVTEQSSAYLECAYVVHRGKKVGGGHETIEAEPMLWLRGGADSESAPDHFGAVVAIGIVPPFRERRLAVGDEPAVEREGGYFLSGWTPMANKIELVTIAARVAAHFGGRKTSNFLNGGVMRGVRVISKKGERRPVPEYREGAMEELGG